MRPDFALFLSFEGISLLFRAADGWRRVGDVALDTEDLTTALSDLNEKALKLAPKGITCKLIIPNDQIRFLSIATGSFEGETRREMARAALEGATPYDVADLVFDLFFEGSQTFIAAVAADTLNEAAEFARMHGFDPVSFSAIPDGIDFPGEPFFGQTADAPDVLPDTEPTNVVGPVFQPERQDQVESDEETPPLSLSVDDTVDTPVPAGFASRRRKPSDDSHAPTLSGATRDVPITPSDSNDMGPKGDKATLPPPSGSEALAIARPDPSVQEEELPSSFVAPILSQRESGTERSQPEAETAQVMPAPTASEFQTRSESERMTIFGARDKRQISGKPRRVGLALTAGLLLVLGAVAVWSALFEDTRVTSPLATDTDATEQAALPTAQAPDVLTTAPGLQQAPRTVEPNEQTESTANTPPDIETAKVNEPDLTTPEASASDVLQDTETTGPTTTEQDEASYALSGVWQRAPVTPDTLSMTDLNDLYTVSIDNHDLSRDAVAIPGEEALKTDEILAAISPPAAAGTAFVLDGSGLVEPTIDGALTPDGILVFLGRPPVVPPATPTRFETEPETELEQQRDRLAALRPNPRPGDLLEQNERSRLGGLTRSELGNVRPKQRPETVKREAEQDETPTAQAIVVSRIPKTRPRDFAQKVQTAKSRTAGPSQQVAAAATVAPRTVSPKIPSSASVARRATMDNAINLRRVNLIGVYGTPSNRRALVRLPSGRYKKVKVGDKVDGGRIVAIGDSELRYQKGSRNVTLKIPSG